MMARGSKAPWNYGCLRAEYITGQLQYFSVSVLPELNKMGRPKIWLSQIAGQSHSIARIGSKTRFANRHRKSDRVQPTGNIVLIMGDNEYSYWMVPGIGTLYFRGNERTTPRVFVR